MTRLTRVPLGGGEGRRRRGPLAFTFVGIVMGRYGGRGRLRSVPIGIGVTVWLVLLPPAAHSRTSPGNGFTTVSCGQTITEDTTLKKDLACGGDGIVIGAPDVTLRLNGHTIRSTTGTGTGVLVDTPQAATGKGISIIGPGAISGFRDGQFTAFNGSRTEPNEVAVRHVSFVDNQWAIRPTGERLSVDSVRISGPNGFPIDSSGTVAVRRSNISVTGLAFENSGGDWTIEDNRFNGGRISVFESRATMRGNRFRDVDLSCFQGTLTVVGNVFTRSPFGLTMCEGSSIEGNRFDGGGAGGTALSLLWMYSSGYGPTRFVGNSFTDWDAAVSIDGAVAELLIVDNVFRRNGVGVRQTTCGTGCPVSDGTIRGNSFLRGTGDAVTLAHGTWHVGSNVFRNNGGHAVVAAGEDLLVVDEGGNTARGNLPPQCTGAVCTGS